MNLRNWKTTVSGAILLLGGIVLFCINRPIEGSMCVVAGVGLFNAKDATTTGVGENSKTLHEINKEK
jgi:hypothetical protein